MYRKSLRAIIYQRKVARCAAMRAAKERKRLARAAECAGWTRHEYKLVFTVSPDGRAVGLAVNGKWCRCGSERTIRALLARAIWRKANGNNQN